MHDSVIQHIDSVIQHNEFFRHPENMLFGLITDTRRYICTLGVRLNLLYRNEFRQISGVREFIVYFAANDYINVNDRLNLKTELSVIQRFPKP